MKKFIFTIIIIIITGINLCSQPAWVPMYSGATENLTDVYFIDGLTGYACGGFRIYRTYNAGYNWTSYTLPDTTYLQSIRFINQNTGYVCGGRTINQYWSLQQLYKTTNGGTNWYKVQEMSGTMTDEAFTDVFPVDSLVYLCSGGYANNGVTGKLYKSQNSGINFSQMNVTSFETFGKISFINSQTGWITSSYGTDVPLVKRKIFKTTNAGQNWALQYRDSTFQNVLNYQNFELQFVNQNTGYGLYRNNYNLNNTKFLRTSNGGETWDTTVFSHNLNRAMFFANDSLGWIAGPPSQSINIMRTSNRGQNWQTSWMSNNIINSIYFVNTAVGFAVGNNGVILRTFTSGLPGVSIRNISAEVPNAYSLSQNYPNPFNPMTNVKFSIVNAGDVMIVVYDIQGREVQTLVNERLNAGTYEVKFDGSMLTSGVYFYKMVTGGFTETKKMLLIK
ncbi:MAG: T9SS type A sorting domain-containing protein [Ignavibacteria bacterium]